MRKSILIFSLPVFMLFSACSPEQTSPTSKIVCDDSLYQLACPKQGDNIAILKTSMGIIKFKLFHADVPETVKNFEMLANQGKYNNVPFHRVIKDFMIQGGDFENKNGTGGYSYQGPGSTIAEEFSEKLKHLQWTVSMAKTSAPHTTGSQFFIVHNLQGTKHLDNVHSVFGQVYQGTEVVDAIANTATGAQNRPLEDILIEKAVVTTFGSEEDKEY